jgi:hypothetical protein
MTLTKSLKAFTDKEFRRFYSTPFRLQNGLEQLTNPFEIAGIPDFPYLKPHSLIRLRGYFSGQEKFINIG